MSVPKIIHQLWIGEKPAPINAMNSIKNMNPDFEYMFWNEKMIEDKLTIPPRYQRKIENHSAIWGKADMYRFLILEQFGGVFVDADMVSIEPLDDFLLNKGFFCWENEISRPNLCATSLQAYPPHHIIPRSAIDWIMNNNVYDTKTPSWELVGPGLLTRVYHSLSDKSVVNVFPSYYGLPDHHSGTKYMGHGKVYMSHEWGSTWNNYQKINDMDIPPHHKEPKQSITIDIPDSANIKSIMKAIKSMEGHFHIYVNYNGNIEKYFNNMRFVSHVNTDVKTSSGSFHRTPRGGDVNNILDSNRDLTLTEIMNEEGSDKGQGRHDYTIKYQELFNDIKDEINTFCEIGLGTNNPHIKSSMGINGIPLASVRGWKRYFKNATIYGGDVDKNILENDEDIKTHYIDMLDEKTIKSFWEKFDVPMDIILDDGLHEFEANVKLFENSYDKFNNYYIIEDIGTNYLSQWRVKLQEWIRDYPSLNFELFLNDIPSNNYDNNLIIITQVCKNKE